MDTKNLSTLKIHKLTQAQYDRELAAGRIDENALYLTPDEGITLDDVAETSTKSYFHIIRGTSTDGRAYYGSIDESVEIQNGTIIIFIPEMTSTLYTELSLTITNKNGSEYYGQIVRVFSTMDDVAYDLDAYARMFNTSTYFTVNIPYVLIYMNGYWVVLGDQKILGDDINGAVDKANKDGSGNVITDTYATKTELDNLELITIEDIDAICNTIIQTATASEVTF